MPTWVSRLIALHTHGILIARRNVDFSDLVTAKLAERLFYDDTGDGMFWLYQITEQGRCAARYYEGVLRRAK